jgi:hypothetical protein
MALFGPDAIKVCDAAEAALRGTTVSQSGRDVTVRGKIDVPTDAIRNLIKTFGGNFR